MRPLFVVFSLIVASAACAQSMEDRLDAASRDASGVRASTAEAQRKLEEIRARRAGYGTAPVAVVTGAPVPPVAPVAAAPQPAGRIRVGVLPFDNRVPQIPGNFVDGIEAMLIEQGLNRTEWVMLDRVLTPQVLTEQKFARSGLVQRGTGPATGMNLGAQVLIKGVVTELTAGSSGGGFGIGFRGVSVGRGGSKSTLGMDIRIIDAATGEVLAAAHKSTRVKSSDLSVGFAGRGGAPALAFNNFKNSPMGEAARNLVGQILDMLAATLPRVRIATPSVPQWNGRVAKIQGGRVYVNGGQDVGLAPGMQLKVFAESSAVVDPQTGENLGSERQYTTLLSVLDVQPRFAVCTVQSGRLPRVNDAVEK